MMKTTLNRFELKKLKACESGYATFVDAHGDDDVTLSQALESNGWDDIWWYISAAYSEFSQQQKDELNLLGCDWAESVLINFESRHPADKRPRLAIKAKRDFVNGLIGADELKAAAESAAESAARSAAWSAAESARSAAWSAAESAESAESAARSARSAWSAARSAQKQDLMSLFMKWESQS